MEGRSAGTQTVNFGASGNLKADFIQVLPKAKLFERLPRGMSSARMRELVLMIRRAVDPDAPFGAGR